MGVVYCVNQIFIFFSSLNGIGNSITSDLLVTSSILVGSLAQPYLAFVPYGVQNPDQYWISGRMAPNFGWALFEWSSRVNSTT